MLLFLDFDGVLHPECLDAPIPEDLEFCHLPRFEAVMRDFPSVEIVISSMWRYEFTLDQLRLWFSPDVAARIIGVTPQTNRDGKYLAARREGEIIDWLAAAGRADNQWIAIDDAVWQFNRHLDRLVACTGYIGLDAAVEVRLRAALSLGKPSAEFTASSPC